MKDSTIYLKIVKCIRKQEVVNIFARGVWIRMMKGKICILFLNAIVGLPVAIRGINMSKNVKFVHRKRGLIKLKLFFHSIVILLFF